MLIAKWGNSLAVRLPKALVEKLQLKEGDEVEIVSAEDGRLELTTAQSRREQAMKRLASLKMQLPPDYKFDREEANSRDPYED